MSLSDAGLTLLRPFWLLALIPLLLMAVNQWWPRQPRLGTEPQGTPDVGGPWGEWVDQHLQRHVLGCEAERGGSPRAQHSVLAGIVAVLVVCALAGPAVSLPDESSRASRPLLTRVLLVDLSPAFSALPEERQEQVRSKLKQALYRLPEAETALVVYAEEAYLVVPPSGDSVTVAQFLPDLSASAIPLSGDRPEMALQLVSELLARTKPGPRELLWVSPAPASRLAATLAASQAPADLAVHVLSVGIEQPAAVKAGRLNVITLREDDSDLSRLRLLSAEGGQTTGPVALRPGWVDLGPYLLLIILPLAMRLLPRGPFDTFRTWGALLAPLLALLVLAHPGSGWAAPGDTLPADARAVAYYRLGEYAQAAALWEPYDDPDALYNRGNALAHLGRLVDALSLYEAALAKRPDDADIRYNRDVVQRLLKPPPAAADSPPPTSPRDQAAIEAARAAEQWLRRVPDAPQRQPGQPTLLQRKLRLEHDRRHPASNETVR